MTQVKQLVNGVLKGDRRSIAKTITLIENNQPEAQKVISLLYPHTGGAHIIGVTGSTGSGKSTLIEKLIRELRRSGKTVGVVAVDPTSPFTGGAFLGDRVRMQDLSIDEGVFIRSMATRGSLGGLAKATKDAVKVLDAAGKNVLIVETVGAGQTEVDIIKIAHTVVVVLAPGFGDDIQAIKAGIMEIGDIFVINKADRENANRALVDVETMLGMNQKKREWEPPVVKTTAITGEGIPELVEKINGHRSYLKGGGLQRQRLQRVESELEEAIKLKMTETVLNDLKGTSRFSEFLHKILDKEMDPNSAAEILLKQKLKNTGRESR